MSGRHLHQLEQLINSLIHGDGGSKLQRLTADSSSHLQLRLTGYMTHDTSWAGDGSRTQASQQRARASATAVDASSPAISAFAALLPPVLKNGQCCDQHRKSQVLTTRGMKGRFAERWRAPPYGGNVFTFMCTGIKQQRTCVVTLFVFDNN